MAGSSTTSEPVSLKTLDVGWSPNSYRGNEGCEANLDRRCGSWGRMESEIRYKQNSTANRQ